MIREATASISPLFFTHTRSFSGRELCSLFYCEQLFTGIVEFLNFRIRYYQTTFWRVFKFNFNEKYLARITLIINGLWIEILKIIRESRPIPLRNNPINGTFTIRLNFKLFTINIKPNLILLVTTQVSNAEF